MHIRAVLAPYIVPRRARCKPASKGSPTRAIYFLRSMAPLPHRPALLLALLAACLAGGTGLAAAARTAATDAAVAAAAAGPEVRLVGRFFPGDDAKPAKLPQV